MTKFEPQQETDFLKNEYFVQWVLSPSRESSAYWRHWLQQNPGKAEMLSAARDLVLSFDLKETHAMDDGTYYKILDNLLYANQQQNLREANRTPRSWLLAAASIIILCSLSLAGYFFLSRGPAVQQPVPVIAFQHEVIPAGFKKTVTLPDGSVVNLNSASELRYPDQFADTLREVYLTGQAFFEVTKNAHAPFVVRTQYFSTRVLGTSFDIRAYENERDNHVAVLTGKVQVQTAQGDDAQLLLPYDVTSYNEKQRTLKKSNFDPAVLMAWRKGVIAFDRADFEEVKTSLSRWYAVEFIVDKGFRVKGLYTGRFEKDESLTTVLKGISYSSHFSFRVAGRKVFISAPKP